MPMDGRASAMLPLALACYVSKRPITPPPRTQTAPYCRLGSWRVAGVHRCRQRVRGGKSPSTDASHTLREGGVGGGGGARVSIAVHCGRKLEALGGTCYEVTVLTLQSETNH